MIHCPHDNDVFVELVRGRPETLNIRIVAINISWTDRWLPLGFLSGKKYPTIVIVVS